MVRIRRTQDVEQHVRYGSVYGDHVEFGAGDDVTSADVDTAFWAVEQFDHLELVASYLPTDYPTLQSAAAMAKTDAVSGNDPKPTLIEWIDHIDARRREALLAEIDAIDENGDPVETDEGDADDDEVAA